MSVDYVANAKATPTGGTVIQTQDEPGDGVVQSIDPRPATTRIQVSQTTTATAYEALDAIGGLITFANAARQAGDSVHIEGVTLVDEDAQLAAMDLVLFSAAPGTVTDEAAFDPADAELLTVLAVIPIAAGDYHLFTDNAVAHVDCSVTCVCAATSLYGVLVARGTPTYASTSSIHVAITLVQD